MSYHSISYIISYHIIVYHSISYRIISYHNISYHINYCFLRYGESAILELLRNHCLFPDRVGIFLLSAHLTSCSAKPSNLHQFLIPKKKTDRTLMVRLASSLRVRWAKPPLPLTPSWCGLLIMCKAIIIFILLFIPPQTPPPVKQTPVRPASTHRHTDT